MNKNALIGEFIFWLLIFVVGSFIVTFIIYPQTFKQVTHRISDNGDIFLPEKEINLTNLIKEEFEINCDEYKYQSKELGIDFNDWMERNCRILKLSLEREEGNLIYMNFECINKLVCYYKK